MGFYDYWDGYGTDLTGGSSSSSSSTGSMLSNAATAASGVGSSKSDSGGSGWLGALGSAANSVFGDWKPGDYLDAARLGLAYVNSNKPLKFDNIPLSPEQKKLWDLFYAQQTDPKTANNRAQVSDYARGMLSQLHPTWDAPKTSKGETGYAGNAGMKFPEFDWNNYNKGGGGSTSTDTPSTPGSGINSGEGVGPTGAGGDPFGHVTSPAGSANDPFANLPSINGQPLNVSGVSSADMQGVVKQYGKAGVELIMAIVTGNPSMGLKGAVDAVRSYYNGQPLDQMTASAIQRAQANMHNQNTNMMNQMGNDASKGLAANGLGPTTNSSPRQDWTPGMTEQDGMNFIANQNYRLEHAGSPAGDPTNAGGISNVINRRTGGGAGGRN